MLRDRRQVLGRGSQTIGKPRWLFGEGSLHLDEAQSSGCSAEGLRPRPEKLL